MHTVVNRLKLKPLLVTHNRYYNTPLGIRNLANLRRKFDADILIQNVNPWSVKKIIRTTLRRLGSFHWPAIAGQNGISSANRRQPQNPPHHLGSASGLGASGHVFPPP